MKAWVCLLGVMLLSGGCITPFYGNKALSVTEGKDKAVITFDSRGQQLGVFYFTKTDEFDEEKAFQAYGSHPVMTLPVEGSIEMYVKGQFYAGYHVHKLYLNWRSNLHYLFWSESFDIWTLNPGINDATGRTG